MVFHTFAVWVYRISATLPVIFSEARLGLWSLGEYDCVGARRERCWEQRWRRLPWWPRGWPRPSDPQRWWRNPGQGPSLAPASCPLPSSTSFSCSETRSLCVARWGSGSEPVPPYVVGKCTCWRETLSPAPAAVRACTLSVCACSLLSPSYKALGEKEREWRRKWVRRNRGRQGNTYWTLDCPKRPLKTFVVRLWVLVE